MDEERKRGNMPLATRTAKQRPRREGTLGQTSKGAARVGRKRIIEPDASKREGQCALYLQKLMEGRDVEEVAGLVGVSRATMFNYLGGTTTPSDTIRDRIAQAIGLRDFRDLMPTDEFLRSIGQAPGRKSRRS